MFDGQWRLVYPGTDLTFGDGEPYLLTAPPEFANADPEVQDAPHPGSDGVRFGRDVRPGQTVTFELGVHTWTEDDDLAAHAALKRAWRGDSIRRVPGAVAELHMQRTGRERIVYGRPRRFASVLTMAPWAGYSGATADFVCADDLFYDAAATTVIVPIAAPPSGGIMAPITAPINTTAPSTVPGQVDVGGLVDTWPVITFEGPVSQPSVNLPGLWRMTLNTTLAFDQSVTIDTRPWARTVLRSDGASLAGKLTRGSVSLSKAYLPAGAETQLQFIGTDETGTAQLTISFRNAYPHI